LKHGKENWGDKKPEKNQVIMCQREKIYQWYKNCRIEIWKGLQEKAFVWKKVKFEERRR